MTKVLNIHCCVTCPCSPSTCNVIRAATYKQVTSHISIPYPLTQSTTYVTRLCKAHNISPGSLTKHQGLHESNPIKTIAKQVLHSPFLQDMTALMNQFAHQLLKNINPVALFHFSMDKQRNKDRSNSTSSQMVALGPLAVLFIMPQEPQQVTQQTDVRVRQCQQYLAHSLTPLVRLTVQFWYERLVIFGSKFK